MLDLQHLHWQIASQTTDTFTPTAGLATSEALAGAVVGGAPPATGHAHGGHLVGKLEQTLVHGVGAPLLLGSGVVVDAPGAHAQWPRHFLQITEMNEDLHLFQLMPG